jgi:catechol 2,3-dioxygenase-like lactoylglutathione lyase family enzyme
MLGAMTIQRMDNVGVVVDDLAAATAFFVELGMELEGEAPVEGRWVDRVVGLDDVRVDIAMLRTPDGHSRLELTKFHTPTAVSAEPNNAPANTLGIRRIMFAVDDIEDVLARLHAHGAELVGELAQYEDSYRPGGNSTSFHSGGRPSSVSPSRRPSRVAASMNAGSKNR